MGPVRQQPANRHDHRALWTRAQNAGAHKDVSCSNLKTYKRFALLAP